MEEKEIVEVKLLRSLKTNKEILKPGIYYPPIPSDILVEVSQNRGIAVATYRPVAAIPQEQTTESEKPKVEIPKETKPVITEPQVRRRKK